MPNSGRVLIGRTAPGANDAFPNRPQRPPTGATGSGVRGPGAVGGINVGNTVFQQANYLNIIQVPQTMQPADGSLLFIVEPPSVRAFLQIRNAMSSLGMLAVGYGIEPNDETLAMEMLAPGQSFKFNAGEFVPQNRVYIRAFNGVCYAVGAYANYGDV